MEKYIADYLKKLKIEPVGGLAIPTCSVERETKKHRYVFFIYVVRQFPLRNRRIAQKKVLRALYT